MRQVPEDIRKKMAEQVAVPKRRHVLIHAIDLDIPPGQSAGDNNAWVEFRTYLGLVYYCIANPYARDALKAGRVQILHIGKDKPRQSAVDEEPTTDLP